ncbi:MAG TPA: zinc ribbon domain-containing protein [Verrucomicrobiae bacterium]|nr:zinc ribbon domain-containing protein [Verrucomicrobiae bacterium]
MPPDVCPHCGAEIPPGAKACPECGSDEKTGWSERARYDNLDLPEENFDYQDYLKREFGRERIVPRGVHWFWWIVTILVVVGLVCLWLL